MAKVPKVLGEVAPKFSGTAFYTNGTGAKVERAIYTLPKREACLMAMSYSYDLQHWFFWWHGKDLSCLPSALQDCTNYP